LVEVLVTLEAVDAARNERLVAAQTYAELKEPLQPLQAAGIRLPVP
jgi:hypothetical protein